MFCNPQLERLFPTSHCLLQLLLLHLTLVHGKRFFGSQTWMAGNIISRVSLEQN